jgi:beta-galactosidase
MPPGVSFGAAYYHEYHVPGRVPDAESLAADLDLMVAAGFTAIRVGESVWSTWEPEPGRFDLDWLQPVLDGAHARGIGVILGTPTYAVPPWMARLHPEIAAETATGSPTPWGSRQEADVSHPMFRRFAERVIRKVVGRYRDHPAVIGYQVDNEPGIRLFFNDHVFQRFIAELADRYGMVDALNEEWGLTYWSHRLSDFADLWRPDGNLQPQYDLAWRRFQASLISEYIGWQADLVHELVGTDALVTTCLSMDQSGVDDVAISRHLSVTSGNAYYEPQEALTHPSTAPMSPGWIVSGTWAVYQLADLMFSARQAPFLITETNAASIGHGSTNLVPYDGQLRQVTWALVSRGARMIEYWHWRTLHYGTETYWGGVLPHDGRPGRIYAEVARIGAELGRVGHAVANALPDADLAFVFDSDSKWALGFGPAAPLPGPSGWGDPDSYRRMTLPFYRGAFDADLQVGTVRPDQLMAEDAARFAARRPVLVATGWYTTTDEHLAWLDAYAAAGGHLLIGPRTAYGDCEGRARTQVKPAGLATAAGVSYAEFANLEHPVPVVAPEGSPLAGANGSGGEEAGAGAATLWVDYLEAGDADVLLGYDHPHLRTWAAATTKVHGDGRITVVGTIPDQRLARAILRWAAPAPVSGWPDLPDGVRVTTASAPDGSRIAYVHHWAWGEVTVRVPVEAHDLLEDQHLAAGAAIGLGPWDVRVLRLNNLTTERR